MSQDHETFRQAVAGVLHRISDKLGDISWWFLSRDVLALGLGEGQVVLATRGPVREIKLKPGSPVITEGKYVIARTGDVRFSVRRPTKNFLGRFTAGEGLVRVFEGEGKLLLNPAPYWRYRVFAERSGQPDDSPSRMTS